MKVIFLFTIVVGHRHRLLRIAGVVTDLQLQLLSEDAALGIDVGDRHFGTLADLVAGGCILTGHRAGDGDDDARRRRCWRRG
jgi:oligoribonuclease (3'-5' exoribonuclease)